MEKGVDFAAYKKFTEMTRHDAVVVMPAGDAVDVRDDFVMVNWDEFRKADPAHTSQFARSFATAMAGRQYERETVESRLNTFMARVAYAQKGGDMQVSDGGGTAEPDMRVFYFDAQTNSLIKSSKELYGTAIKASARSEELYDIWTREHEAAHLFLDMDEAGADYVASMRLRMTHSGAETDALLRRIADERTLAIFRTENTKEENPYTYACTQAIEEALKTKLPKGKLFSGEELQKTGTNFDIKNDEMKQSRVDFQVVERLRDVSPGTADKDFMRSDLAASGRALIKSGEYDDWRIEHEILSGMVQSADRVTGAIKAQEAAVPSGVVKQAVLSPAQP
jgi:hypothetical protein